MLDDTKLLVTVTKGDIGTSSMMLANFDTLTMTNELGQVCVGTHI